MDCAHSINDSHTVVRHIRKNYGIGANADIIPNLYPSDYLHTGSDIYIISDVGGSLPLHIVRCAFPEEYGHTHNSSCQT